MNKQVKSVVLISKNPEDEKILSKALPEGYSIAEVKNIEDAEVLLSCGLQATVINTQCISENSILRLKEAALFKPVLVLAHENKVNACINALRDGADGYFELPKESELLKYSLERKLGYHDTHAELEELSYRLLLGKQNGVHSFEEFRTAKQASELPITIQELSRFFHRDNHVHPTFLETLCSILNHDGIGSAEASFNVLLVEDEPEIRRILYHTLENNGFSCDQVDHGEKVMPILSAKPFDVVILDIGLPGIAGDDLIANIKGAFPDIEIVMLTSYADIKRIKRCFAAGASDYLLKPYDRTNLCLKVLSACQNKQLRLMMKNTKQTLLDTLSRRQKEDVLTFLYHTRCQENKPLRMKDLYLVFPELQQNNKDCAIPDQIIHDGIGLFVDVLEQSLKEGLTSEQVIASWD